MLLRYTVVYISFYYAINAIHEKKKKKKSDMEKALVIFCQDTIHFLF